MKLYIFLGLVLLSLVNTYSININTCATTTVLSVNGGSYDLTQDINTDSTTCLAITGDNVNLDCHGYTLTGNKSIDSTGIYLSSSGSNPTIENCKIEQFRRGIDVRPVGTLTIDNVTIFNNTEGIYIDGTIGSINNSNFSENENWDYQREDAGTNCNTIIENTVGSGGYPIALYNSTVFLSNQIFSYLDLCNADNSILNNISLIGSSAYKNNRIDIDSSENIQLYNINSSNNLEGIYIRNSNNVTLENITTNQNAYVGLGGFTHQLNLRNIISQNNGPGYYYGIDYYVEGSNFDINFCTTPFQNVSTQNGLVQMYNSTTSLSNQIFGTLALCNSNNHILENITINGEFSLENVNNSNFTNIISFQSMNFDTIENNYFNTIPGFSLFYSNSNSFHNVNGPVRVWGSDFNSIDTLTIDSETYGVQISSNSNYNNVSNMGINNISGTGIYISSDSNRVVNGTIQGGTNGLQISSDYNTIVDVSISGNDYGLYFLSSDYNTVINSSIFNSSLAGLYIFSSSSNNVLTNNYFSNTNNVLLTTASNNVLNTTFSSNQNILGYIGFGGNFWGYPNGTGFSQTCDDVNEDNICDSPYNIGGTNNVDSLPLAGDGFLIIGPGTENSVNSLFPLGGFLSTLLSFFILFLYLGF
jgi:parallel beta-helix repeat protein